MKQQIKLWQLEKKTDAIDYKYIPEPNIPVILLSADLINTIKIDLLPNQIKKILEKHQIQPEFIEQIIDHRDYWQFINTIKHPDLNQSVKIFFKFIVPLIKANHLLATSLKIKPSDVAKLIDCLKAKIITPNQLKSIITTLANSSTTLVQILKKLNRNSSIDQKQIENWINDLKQAHPDLEIKYKTNPVATLKFIMGQIMHKSQGWADPILIRKVINLHFN